MLSLGLLQPLSIPFGVFSGIIIDFVEGLLKSHGKSMIFAVFDKLTKYAHFVSLSHSFSVSTIAQVFMDNI